RIGDHRLHRLDQPAIAAMIEIGRHRLRASLDDGSRTGCRAFEETQDGAEICRAALAAVPRDLNRALPGRKSENAVGRAEIDADTHGDYPEFMSGSAAGICRAPLLCPLNGAQSNIDAADAGLRCNLWLRR